MHALIIANGRSPSPQLVRKLLKHADLIVCADGGANHARRLKIKPDVILGDMDSVTSPTKAFFKSIPQLFIEDENSTDLEKAIEFCIQRKAASIDVIGWSGDRIDHTTGSLGCFKKYGSNVRLRLVDSVGEVTLIQKRSRFKTRKGERLSLIPLERCSGVTTKNLKYGLQNETLELGVREGISNEATASMVTITVKKGTLLLYRINQ
ncbi:MAG: thiamine diphosphokinase [Ignavibacteriae bacterium]|nr:thiamine diphosphokinase [Ignavibacteriota bacterium]